MRNNYSCVNNREDKIKFVMPIRSIKLKKHHSTVTAESVSAESKRHVPVISIVKDIQGDPKQQLKKCKRAHNAYLMLAYPA